MIESQELLRCVPFLMFALYLISTTWILIKYPRGGHISISEHISADTQQFRRMGLLFSFITLMFVTYFLLWLAPSYHLSEQFVALAVLFLISGLGISWLPADFQGSRKRTHILHVTSVFVLYFTVMAYSVLTVFATKETAPITHLAAQVTLVIYLWLIGLYFLYRPAHKHFIFYETIGVSAFFALTIVMALKV